VSKKILVIDDDDQDRKAMTIALQRDGYDEVTSAKNGAQGFEIVKSFKPDIIVIDVVLKDIDGFDLCRQIKLLEGFNGKIIMVTGHLDAVNAKKARKSGTDELLEKTLDFENINQTINNLFRQ